MKRLLVGLALWVGSTQTVTFTNCCQGSLCSRKDNCPACPESGSHGQDDCCGTGASPNPGDPGCVHLEPSYEVDSSAPAHLDFMTSAWVELISPAEFLIPSDLSQNMAPAPQGESPPDTPPRLYLRHLALLI